MWPKDRETIFPLQAAAGYAMLRGLLAQHDNVLADPERIEFERTLPAQDLGFVEIMPDARPLEGRAP
jgi:hypothetical protein